MEKCLIIEIPRFVKKENGTEVIFKVAKEDVTHNLMFFVETEYEQYLCENRCDAAVVAVLQYAIRNEYDIECRGTISQTLFYNLNYQLIPALFNSDKSIKHQTQVRAEKTDSTVYSNATGVAMGISCGVDSFHALYEYTNESIPEKYRVTHLTYFKNGAHHGQTSKTNDELQKRIFDEQVHHVRNFCKEYKYKLIVIDSNLTSFLNSFFKHISYENVHTYQSLSFAFLLPKLIGTYYYASSGLRNDGIYKIDLAESCTNYDIISLPLLATETFHAYSAGCDVSRLQKIKTLAYFDKAHDWLLVCLRNGKNCGRCLKCERTLIELDVTDTLELYKNSFDIAEYMTRRCELIYRICKKALLNEDDFYNDVFCYASENNPHWFDCLTKEDKGRIIFSVLLCMNQNPEKYADKSFLAKVPDWMRCISLKQKVFIKLSKHWIFRKIFKKAIKESTRKLR